MKGKNISDEEQNLFKALSADYLCKYGNSDRDAGAYFYLYIRAADDLAAGTYLGSVSG